MTSSALRMPRQRNSKPGLRAQLCGDAHMLNFRLLASPERQRVFDINDFDETLPGPWEWDVKRLAAGLVIAGRANGFGANKRRQIVTAGVRAYREWMRHFASRPTIDVWRAQANMELIQDAVQAQMPKHGQKQLAAATATARRRNNALAVRKLTIRQGISRRIVADPPLLVHVNQLAADRSRDEIAEGLTSLIRYYVRTLPSIADTWSSSIASSTWLAFGRLSVSWRIVVECCAPRRYPCWRPASAPDLIALTAR